MRHLLALGLTLALPANAADGAARLAFRPDCVLAAVAARKGVTLSPDRPAPRLRLASATPVAEYLEAAKEQLGGAQLDVILNMFVAKTNEIYLNDSARLYGRHGRTLDDSLAHEYTHFIQHVYEGAPLFGDSTDSLEEEAVRVQTWFREAGSTSLPGSCRAG